tara:strand:+ start:512 stop:1168 length:657 start_codon:yes stop_codon:yes gene_type:complete
MNENNQTDLAIDNLDWPNLAYYRDQNKILNNSEKNKNQVVFMGDSITEGWSNFYPEFFKRNNFINRGISGQTTPQMLIRFKPDVVDLSPRAVIILGGTNDIAGNTGPSTTKMITDNIFSMAEIGAKNNIPVFLSSVLPVYKYIWNLSIENPSKKILKLNEKINGYAKSNDLIYIDYYSSMVDERGGLKKEFSGDGVHPNKDGYDIMSNIVSSAIDTFI